MVKLTIVSILSFVFAIHSSGQCSMHPVSMNHESDIQFQNPKECMSAIHDQQGKNYLYVAGKERGLVIYDVSNIAAPMQIDSIKTSDMQNMEVMSVSQNGNYLYLALGNIFVNSSTPGMAIVDVSDPTHVVLKSVWKYNIQSGGAGIVKTEGNYAYLGAMRRGLMILDISDKTNIVLISVFKPDISYPNPTNPDSLKYNARGLAVKNSIVYLCDDAGGIRIIDATNKAVPQEKGHYANPAVYSKARAYNNVALDDTLLYVSVDYCGMEILSVADIYNVKMVSWWNPWHCESPSNIWLNSNGHTNELQYDPACKIVFLASGKSEVIAVNVADPTNPDSCTKYTTSGGNVGTWGLALYNNLIYACYIYVPTGIPFYSNWSGVKAFSWNSCATYEPNLAVTKPDVRLYPNPSGGKLYLQSTWKESGEVVLKVFDLPGKLACVRTIHVTKGENTADVSLNGIQAGVYIAEINVNGYKEYKQIVINPSQQL